MPDLTHKSVGNVAESAGAGSTNVPQPALADGDVAILLQYDNGKTTPSAPTNYTHFGTVLDGTGGAFFAFWRRASSTIGATNVSVSWAGQGFGKIAVASGSTSGIGAPALTGTFNLVSASTYWQTPAVTVTDRLVYSFGWIMGARTQGSLSNQGTITSTNTSRAYETLAGPGHRLQTVSSVITSSSGGAVRGGFTGGNSDALTVAVTMAPNSVAVPTGLDVSAASGALTGTHGAVSGADEYQIRFRQTGLTAPSLTTQTSAAKHLHRMFNATPGAGTSYPYTWNGSGVRHYCVDSGVRTTHNEFTGRVATGFSLGATSPSTDTINHGTGAASLLGGTTYGVAKGVTLVSVQAIDAATGPGDPLLASELEDIVDFILSDKGSSPAVVTITMSLDGMQEGGTNSPGVQTQLTRLLDAGVPVVVASANLNTDVTSNVAEDDDRLIWAGSSFPDTDARTPGSNYGPANLLFAPVGEEGYSGNVTTAASNTSDSATKDYGATSGATPAIGGVMAKNKQANPDLSPARIQEILFSQARQGIITSVPTGPNHLVNSNAIVTDWSIHSLGTSTSWSLDGLGYGTSWEVQVRAIDNGVASDWSSSDTATTAPPTITGTPTANTPAVTVAVPTVAWSGTVTEPTVTGAVAANTPTATVDVPTVTWSGTVTPPVYSGTPAADTPTVTVAVPTVAWSGTVTAPGISGAVTADTPAVTVDVPTVTWSGTVTAPTYTGAVAADTPAVTVSVPTVAWTGTVTPPVYAGTLTADTPTVSVDVPTVAWSGTFTAPGVIGGSIAADTPPVTVAVPTVVWAGTFTPPVYTGTLVATLPTVTVGVPTCMWTGVIGGGGPAPIPVHRTLLLSVPHRTLTLSVPHRTLEWSDDE